MEGGGQVGGIRHERGGGGGNNFRGELRQEIEDACQVNQEGREKTTAEEACGESVKWLMQRKLN